MATNKVDRAHLAFLENIKTLKEKKHVHCAKLDVRPTLQAMIKVNVYYVLSVKRLHVLAVQSVKIVVLAGMATIVRRAILVNIASLLWKILRNVLRATLEGTNQTMAKQAAFLVLQVCTRIKQESPRVLLAQ